VIKLREIQAVLWVVLIVIVSGCSKVQGVGATPSANDMRVYFYTGLWGASGLLCSVAVPDNGTAPICPEALEAMDEDKCKSQSECARLGEKYVPDVGSIAFGYWQGFHVVCLESGQDESVLCVQGMLPDDNRREKVIAHMKAVRGYPEFLNPLEVTIWEKEQLGKVTKIRGWRAPR